ncbi:OmpA family protein [Photobacterium sanguinicancri]|uniref:OmpA family protein n=1 Tax=Photobacterium sanguinicancri TaxID=875932 RepID=A0AAW7Y3Z0_9GAMM|nr:OmpA family protein [Photobacterium sanguinicancri]MDO6543072.1 OmpA family protein [Photobacterium sanguinicancri]
MMKRLLPLLLVTATNVYADETLLQHLCETTAFNQELTITQHQPVIIAHNRNGQMLAGKPVDLNLSAYTELLADTTDISRDCLAYLEQNDVVRIVDNDTSPQFQSGQTIARVFFTFDRSTLSKTSVRILEKIAGQLKHSNAMIQLEGHTDAKGSAEYNLALGLRRSESVEAFLKSRGMHKNQLKASSKGESAPVADNSTETGRELNRRVEIKV